jgi:leucyl-tRNA synthetase
LLAVVTPHWSEHIWLEVLKKPDTIHNARFPEIPPVDPSLTAEREYVRVTLSNVTSAQAAQLKRKAKGRDIAFDPKKPKKLTIFMNEKFPAWQEKYVELLKELWDQKTKSVNDKELNVRIGKLGEAKKAMPFVGALRKRLQAGEAPEAVLARKLAFDEKATLMHMIPGLKRAALLAEAVVVAVGEDGKKGVKLEDGSEVRDLPQVAEGAVPGTPTFLYENVA